MTHDEFEALHGECAKALGDYTTAATALCRLPGELAERTPTLADRNRILTQPTIENDLFAQYYQIRGRLLNAAREGYGNMPDIHRPSKPPWKTIVSGCPTPSLHGKRRLADNALACAVTSSTRGLA
jgi:hypothetical protein